LVAALRRDNTLRASAPTFPAELVSFERVSPAVRSPALHTDILLTGGTGRAWINVVVERTSSSGELL